MTKSYAQAQANTSSLADPDLLRKIDGLLATGVGDLIDLPQMIVVGDQSSGKSSVLEGLARLPFPRDSGLCTRFATQITFRRAETDCVNVSIMPGQGCSTEHATKVRSWSRPDIAKLERATFVEIMAEVHEVMGLRDKESSDNLPTFSDDTLRIEICGPAQQHFSVIDVPGIIRVCTEGVTTDADKLSVRSMVERYMRNHRSIILAVVPANVDIATQEILTMAKDADPSGTRTVGVLTKPDLVDEGAEKGVVDLLEGRRQKLALGWCIVRNLGQKELEDESDRDALENKFFSTHPSWRSLSKEQVGVTALKLRLQDVLGSRVRAEFPKVKVEISKKLSASRSSLRALGPQRDSATEQRDFLLGISMEFQDVVAAALKADYADNDWFDEHPSLRFATRVVDRHSTFKEMMQDFGHFYPFQANGYALSYVQQEQPDSRSIQNEISESDDDLLSVREFTGMPDLDINPEAVPITIKRDVSILDWLSGVYRKSRGFELGTFDSSLLAIAMKSQSSNWAGIALGCAEDVICLVHQFIVKLLELVCPDQRTRQGLMSVLSDTLHDKYDKALHHVSFLLDVERSGVPSTQNHYFNDNLQKSRDRRAQQVMAAKSLNTEFGKCVRLEEVTTAKNMSNTEHVVIEIHDILESYYRVALKRFTDNVCMQGTGHHLVTGPVSPLRLFSPAFVNNLSEEQLKEIAGEEPALRKQRDMLQKEITILESGKKML